MQDASASIPPLPRHEAFAFCTTHWTTVLNASNGANLDSADAFARLYCDYWPPLYGYLRRRRFSPADAEDVAQAFFTCLIEKQRLAGLEREGGRFRSFLLRSLDHFVTNLWGQERAQKRGAGARPLSLNAADGETRYGLEVPDRQTPESLFEMQWVFTLLANVLECLRAECETRGKGDLFRDLQPHLQGERGGPLYAEVAARHAMSEGAIKVAVHRLRQRYGELLREEIARTVSSPEEVDDELRHLITVSGR